MGKYNRYYLLLFILAVCYCALIVIVPPNASVLTRYGISASQAKMLSLSLAVPLIIIWTVSFYGFIRLKQYSDHVKLSQDGLNLAKIAHGLMFLAIAMPLNSILTSANNYITFSRPHLMPTLMIINNYIALILALAGFYLIYRGTSGLVSMLKKRSQYSRYEHIVMLLFLALSAIYAYLTLTNPARQFATDNVQRAAYYMADFPLVITIIIPYLFVWFLGMRAVYFIYLYRKRVKGVIYRDALKLLAAGLSVVVLSSILIRYFVSIATLLNSLTLRALLITIYLLVFVIFIGYILIARAVRKLQRIEEV